MNKILISFANINNISTKEINSLVKIINDAYKVAEGDLWINSAKRVTFDEMQTLINQNQIIIATNNNEIIGSVKVTKLRENIAEFGMLATAFNHRGLGIGTKLVNAAEDWARNSGFRIMQLELLTPKHYINPSKEILKEWYTKCGYKHHSIEPFKNLFPNTYHLLAVECNFNIYHKNLF
ncbi:GNAT family N-acetyltransferase [Francisella philomiragia]|uniref:GNAT family N-acetyltransferase n=1 Tax=Francisella philomiragia TaxID=28110 RepID=UPI001904E94F|nr:GNAT family N-acetyltransferase [Francisella philomiragia]MBK2295568.1 GNAT family N-acetyltransferase [Francisella philomiragia]MBK2340548.1 GNAT family N-acetyltransferase [Francisella philomiragia]